jgi:hypothetical protein
MMKLTGKVSGQAGLRAWSQHLNAWIRKLLLHDRQVIFSGNRSFAPWFQDQTAEAEPRLGDLERETGILNILEDLAGGVGITNRVVDRGIRRSRDDADDESLVFFRR